MSVWHMHSSHSIYVKTAQFAGEEDYEAMYEALYMNEQASHVYEVIDKWKTVLSWNNIAYMSESAEQVL